ncbi:hypothetical protein EJB05_28066, partial [Eragrostis curvula]
MEVKHLEALTSWSSSNSHPKLCKFEINGAVLEMLSLEDCLEVMITVRSPLNPEQSLSTLECLVKYIVWLRSMRLWRMARTVQNFK